MFAIKSISVVIPVHNERMNVRPLLEELVSVIDKCSVMSEVIIVDDASSDGTTEELREMTTRFKSLRVISLRRNFGQSAALDAGFRRARGEVIVTLDGDGQNDPEDIPSLLSELEKGYDLVAGWRHKRRDEFLFRRLPSVLANWMIRFVTGTKLHDQGCSMRVFRREILSEIRLYGEMHRIFSIIVESMGFSTTEMKVNHRPRRSGESKYSLVRTYKVILDTLLVRFLTGFRSKPIHLFGGIGILSFLGSIFFVAYSVLEKFTTGTPIHRTPALMIGMFFFLMGIQFSLMGILAELLVRNYYESSEQFPYSVKEDKKAPRLSEFEATKYELKQAIR